MALKMSKAPSRVNKITEYVAKGISGKNIILKINFIEDYEGIHINNHKLAQSATYEN